MAVTENVRVKVPCRLSYVFLTNYRLSDKSKKNEYAVTCLIPKTDEATIKKLREGMKKTCIERWGEDVKNWPKDFREKDFFETYLSKNNKDGFFLCDGDKSDDENKQGCVSFVARQATLPPKIPTQPQCGKMLPNGKWEKLVGDDVNEIYSGCYADVVIDIYAYPTKKNEGKCDPGITCTLKAVMKTEDGERLSGSAPVDMTSLFGEEEFSSGEEDFTNI